MSNRLIQRYKIISASTALILVTSAAAQSLVTAQADRLGYVQANCPNVVKQALDTVTAQCSKAGRGKVCYGNSLIAVDLQPSVSNVAFNAPGDTLDVARVKQLTLSSLNVTANTWGVAELKIKADLPDSDASQFVTMVMFGSTQLTDASIDANTAILTQTPGALVRQQGYGTATARVIDQQATAGAIKAAATATRLAAIEGTATARAATPTATGTIQSYQATYAAATAIKLANLINTTTAVPTATQIVPPVLGGPYTSLQAFYFQSADSSACDQAPHDGLLIQSPEGIKRRVTLSIDGATIALGSTIYVTAQPGGFLTINTLEGSAVVTVAGKTETAFAGTAVHVPLDANLRASGTPTLIPATFYAADNIRAVPIQTLPKAIVPIPGLSPGALAINGLMTFSTNYTKTAACGVVTFNTKTLPVTLVTDNQAGTLRTSFSGTNLTLAKAADGTYQGTQSAPVANNAGNFVRTGTIGLTTRYIDTTHLSGTLTDDFGDNCVVQTPVTIDLSVASLAFNGTPTTTGQPISHRYSSPTPTATLTWTPTKTPTITRTPTFTPSLIPGVTYIIIYPKQTDTPTIEVIN